MNCQHFSLSLSLHCPNETTCRAVWESSGLPRWFWFPPPPLTAEIYSASSLSKSRLYMFLFCFAPILKKILQNEVIDLARFFFVFLFIKKKWFYFCPWDKVEPLFSGLKTTELTNEWWVWPFKTTVNSLSAQNTVKTRDSSLHVSAELARVSGRCFFFIFFQTNLCKVTGGKRGRTLHWRCHDVFQFV